MQKPERWGISDFALQETYDNCVRKPNPLTLPAPVCCFEGQKRWFAWTLQITHIFLDNGKIKLISILTLIEAMTIMTLTSEKVTAKYFQHMLAIIRSANTLHWWSKTRSWEKEKWLVSTTFIFFWCCFLSKADLGPFCLCFCFWVFEKADWWLVE
jgi:hypothetical protein